MAYQDNLQQKIEIARKKGYDDAQIKSFLAKNNISFSEANFPQQGFVGEVKSALSTRGAMAGESLFKSQQGIQTPLSGGLQAIGQGAGAVGDIAFSGLKAITPEFIEKPVGEAVKKVASAIGETQTAQDVAKKYEEFKTAHPEAAANLEATGLIASILPVGMGAKATAKGAEKVAEITAKGALKTAEKFGEAGAGATKFGVKQLSGFDTPTIERIISKPDIFTPESMAKITPENIAKEVQGALVKRIDELSDTGKEYETIKKAKTPVMIESETVKDILAKEGLELGEDGKIITTAESIPLSQGDITALENFLSQYGPEKIATSNAFLNARKALDNLSSWDATKTDASDRIARALRKAYDETGKNQIPGLREIDTKYAPEVEQLRQYKKFILNPDGTLKDNAISYIVNAPGVNRAPILQRLEALSPGLTEKLKDLKAVQDINRVSEFHKVGNYAKGAGIGFVATGMNPLGLLGGLLLTDPNNVIAALKLYAKTKKIADETVNTIVSSLKSGKKMTEDKTKIVNDFVNEKLKEISDMPNRQGGYINLGAEVSGVDELREWVMETAKKIMKDNKYRDAKGIIDTEFARRTRNIMAFIDKGEDTPSIINSYLQYIRTKGYKMPEELSEKMFTKTESSNK